MSHEEPPRLPTAGRLFDITRRTDMMATKKKAPAEPKKPTQRIRFTDPLFAHLQPAEESLPPVREEGDGGPRRIEASDGVKGQKSGAAGSGSGPENPKGKGKGRVPSRPRG